MEPTTVVLATGDQTGGAPRTISPHVITAMVTGTVPVEALNEQGAERGETNGSTTAETEGDRPFSHVRETVEAARRLLGR
jgi:hypothetical protein